jgi:2-dehydropantoate 2-reductase
MRTPLQICVAGAGRIGCYVGGKLLADGHTVSFLARGRMHSDIKAKGLHLTCFDGASEFIPAERILALENPAGLASASIILVATKSRDTLAMADLIAHNANPGTRVVSLQNGVGNVGGLTERLSNMTVLGGMVPFNVTSPAPAHFHCATSGDIIIQSDAQRTAQHLSSPNLMFQPTGDIIGVQWGKLLINLGNGLNALSNIPLKDQLSLRPWRRLMAAQISEALSG